MGLRLVEVLKQPMNLFVLLSILKMKSVKLDYDEIGSVCLVDKDAFDKFWSQLHKLGISVKTTRPTKREPDKGGRRRTKCMHGRSGYCRSCAGF